MLKLDNVCIESTMDYERFTNIVGNREVSETNVKKLMASMSDEHLASIAIVNEKDEIIDGAHRYEACKNLGVPFNFIIMEGYGINEVHVLNTNMKNWTNDDFVHQFSSRYEDGEKVFIQYFKLVTFMREKNIRLNNALLLLEDGFKSGTQPLRDGTFSILVDIQKAEENLEELIELEKVLGSLILTQTFWQTYIIAKRIDGFDADRFLNKIRRAKSDFETTKDNFRNLLVTFEEAYNTGRNPDLSIAYKAKQVMKQQRRIKSEVHNDG